MATQRPGKKTDNRTNGGRFERELGELLAEHGFWAHIMQQNSAGQPADIVAVKGRYHTLIDCKVISDGRGFPLERVEENQKYAMRAFNKKADESCWFALKLPDGSIWMVSNKRLDMMIREGTSRLTEEEIRSKTWEITGWLKAANEWSKDL